LPRAAPIRGPTAPPAPWKLFAFITAAGLVGVVALVSTRWLLASVDYAEGTRHAIAGRTSAAHEYFRRSVGLAPWLLVPAEAFASTALQLSGSEVDSSRRLVLLHEADAALAQARSHSMGGATSWMLAAQLAFGEALAGERNRLSVSRDAFAEALRWRPGDPKLLAQWGWVWLESGDAREARRIAAQALARDPPEWPPCAVLGRAGHN